MPNVNVDNLVRDLQLTEDVEQKKKLSLEIRDIAKQQGIFPASIQLFYEAIGKGEVSGFTVPAINLRGMTYELARAAIRAAKKINAQALIFEIARSEIGYTFQRPSEYAGVCLAAALAEDHKGPVFIQGDHFQVNAKKYAKDPEREIGYLKMLIEEALEAGFYNIDIDSSTLVDINKPTEIEKQRANFEICAAFTKFIREKQPEGLDVSIGGEIGEVGGRNSTAEELDAFMQNYLKLLPEGCKGISKISVQTGTSHGGVVLPDGSIAKVKLDFDTLKLLSKVAKEKYKLSGAVQHGASTLPAEAFHKFPETKASEVHLATEFQNIIYESKHFPDDLRKKIYDWLEASLGEEKAPDQTHEQFIYKTRKKGFGPFKKDLSLLSADVKQAIGKELEDKFSFLFNELRIANTRDLVLKYVK
ncbi:MAG: class II fructose-bisphosphate aldolase [Candidatus Omnitrophota bacterium]